MLPGPFGAFETFYFGLPGAITVGLEVIAPQVSFPGASNLPADLPPIDEHSAAVADFCSNDRCCEVPDGACIPSKVSYRLQIYMRAAAAESQTLKQAKASTAM